MSVNLYNKETKILTQVAGSGGGVAKFGMPVIDWFQGHDSSSNAITADRDGICIIELGGTGPFYIDVYDNGVLLPASWQQQATAKTTFPVIKGHTYYYSGTRSGGVGSYTKSVFYPFVENIVQPIEGGEEYSEEEQVVGVYCDGKPIYKLTVRGYSGNGGVSLGSYNIKYPLKIEGFAKTYAGSSSPTSFPTFGANGETASLVFSPSQVIYRAHGFSYSYSDIDFTIWYTKTTD